MCIASPYKSIVNTISIPGTHPVLLYSDVRFEQVALYVSRVWIEVSANFVDHRTLVFGKASEFSKEFPTMSVATTKKTPAA